MVQYLSLHPKLRQHTTRPTMASTTIQLPSLCLPRVYFKFDESFIERVFNNFFYTMDSYSVVERIDMIPRIDNKTQEPFYLVFVHFRNNVYKNDAVEDFVKRIEAGEEVGMHYDYPWFWKVRKNHSSKPRAVKDVSILPRPSNAPKMVFDPNETKNMKQVIREFKEENP